MSIKLHLSMASVVLMLSACSIDFNSDDDNEVEEEAYQYQVTVNNLTLGQPFSPISLMLHEMDMSFWTLGQAASQPLEVLAEGGDSSQLNQMTGVKMSYNGSAPLMPGENEDWVFEVMKGDNYQLSVATMLVNTNDAFTGKQNIDLMSMEIGTPYSFTVMAYDAGTEMNDEINLPGPAASAEGYNSTRNDVNRVHIHPGVLTNIELSSSQLGPQQKFDNPVAKIIVTRMQ